MTYSVGGSYYCFELRQQAACVATCSFLIATACSAIAQSFCDWQGWDEETYLPFYLAQTVQTSCEAPPASSLMREGSKAAEAWSSPFTTIKCRGRESVEFSYTSQKCLLLLQRFAFDCAVYEQFISHYKSHNIHGTVICISYYDFVFSMKMADGCWWLINKVVYRLDLCLFYALVFIFYNNCSVHIIHCGWCAKLQTICLWHDINGCIV
jgi:hypothetical protein